LLCLEPLEGERPCSRGQEEDKDIYQLVVIGNIKEDPQALALDIPRLSTRYDDILYEDFLLFLDEGKAANITKNGDRP
jgi:hypothetical protein